MQNIIWKDLDDQQQKNIFTRPVEKENFSVEGSVKDVLKKVKSEGDKALLEYTLKFDGIEINNLRVTDDVINAAEEKLTDNEKAAIQVAIANVQKFHEVQKGSDILDIETTPGITCSKLYRPIETVGLYIPGGTAPLFSSIYMMAVPAKIAGCESVILCTPPEPHPAMLYTAKLCGVDAIYRVGGAQAVAAMAYGTETIPKVDKIFGPGNEYVAKAKMLVSQDPMGASIDLPAGPSEVLVIADDTSNPSFVAADLLAQAEHDTSAQVMLVCSNVDMIQKVQAEIKEQLNVLPRKEIAAGALKNSAAVLVDSLKEAIEVSNAYAPEHLILNIATADDYIDQVKHAGSVFLGPYTPESLGDYASGTNHVLPTSGFARTFGGLSIRPFMKSMTVQRASKEGLKNIAQTVETLAEMESLHAHKNAVTVRVLDEK